MSCPKCSSDKVQRYGKTRDGQQRFRCECGKTFSDPKPLAGRSTDLRAAVQALSMLLEGMSIRAVCRLTGLRVKTIAALMVQAGEQCAQFLADTLRDIPAADVQCDEQWGFLAMKERTAFEHGGGADVGDCYVFTAIDRDTKVLLTFHVGKRTSDDAHRFSAKLAIAVSGRPQVSTDGFKPYHVAIPEAFNHAVDHGMLIKQYGSPSASEARRYSPAKIIGCKVYSNSGRPNLDRVCTSHVERHNLSNRMHNRRLTRLTNAFSKKWENHAAMFALYAAWYNFCRRHQTIKTTPAVAAGLTDQPWTLERLLSESAKSTAA